MIAALALASGDTGAGGAAAITLSSSTPSGSAVQYIVIYGQLSTDPTVDGSPCGLTFALAAKNTNGADRTIWVYRAYAASPTTGQPTITWSGTQFASARMIEVSGVLLTGANGANSIVQASTGATWNGTTTGDTETLAAFADAVNNAALIFAVHMAASDATQEGGYTKLATYAATYWRLEAAFLVGQDTSPSLSWASAAGDGGALAFELAAAGGGAAADTKSTAGDTVAANRAAEDATLQQLFGGRTFKGQSGISPGFPRASIVQTASAIQAADAALYDALYAMRLARPLGGVTLVAPRLGTVSAAQAHVAADDALYGGMYGLRVMRAFGGTNPGQFAPPPTRAIVSQFFDPNADFDYGNSVSVTGPMPGVVPGSPRATFSSRAALEMDDAKYDAMFGARVSAPNTRGIFPVDPRPTFGSSSAQRDAEDAITNFSSMYGVRVSRPVGGTTAAAPTNVAPHTMWLHHSVGI